MIRLARRVSAATKPRAGTFLRCGRAVPPRKDRAARFPREGLTVGVAMILVLNPWVEALPVPSPPGATTHHAAHPAPPGASPTTRIDPTVQQPRVFAARLKEPFGKLPLYFVENRGQADPPVAYYVPAAGTRVYLSRAGLAL